MHRENELTRQKTDEAQRTPPDYDVESPATQSDSDSDDQPSTSDVVLVNFHPGEPADPHNWPKVSQPWTPGLHHGR